MKSIVAKSILLFYSLGYKLFIKMPKWIANNWEEVEMNFIGLFLFYCIPVACVILSPDVEHKIIPIVILSILLLLFIFRRYVIDMVFSALKWSLRNSK